MQNYLEEMRNITEVVLEVQFICLDVASRYSKYFVELLKLIHAKFPNVREHGDRRDGRRVYVLKQE